MLPRTVAAKIATVSGAADYMADSAIQSGNAW
jgi:hypothetical protein